MTDPQRAAPTNCTLADMPAKYRRIFIPSEYAALAVMAAKRGLTIEAFLAEKTRMSFLHLCGGNAPK